MQLQSHPCPSAALGGQSGSPNGHLERIRDSIDHVEWMRWSTRYGRAMLAEKRGQNEALRLLVPCVRPELDLRATLTIVQLQRTLQQSLEQLIARLTFYLDRHTKNCR